MSGPSENTEETGDTGPWDCGECGTSPGPAPRLDSGDTGDCGPGPGDPQPPDPKLPFWPKETLCGMLGSGTCARVSMSDHVTISASKSSIRRFVITEKAPTRAFCWLKATTT